VHCTLDECRLALLVHLAQVGLGRDQPLGDAAVAARGCQQQRRLRPHVSSHTAKALREHLALVSAPTRLCASRQKRVDNLRRSP
jgi:hypothetical protein